MWLKKLQFCVRKGPPLYHILRHFNPVYVLRTQFLRSILMLSSTFLQVSLSTRFSHWSYACIWSSVSCMLHVRSSVSQVQNTYENKTTDRSHSGCVREILRLYLGLETGHPAWGSLVFFPHPFGQMPEWYIKLGDDRLFSSPFQLISH
jgi:hypothetical protein